MVFLPADRPLAQRTPKELAFLAVHHQVVERFRSQQIFAGSVKECDPPPHLGFDRMRQLFEAADLVVFLVRAGMVGLVAEQFEAGGEFVPLDLRHILDLRALITETTRKIECQIIHRDHLRSGLEWDASRRAISRSRGVGRRQTSIREVGKSILYLAFLPIQPEFTVLAIPVDEKADGDDDADGDRNPDDFSSQTEEI
jgi:hypothetical protein